MALRNIITQAILKFDAALYTAFQNINKDIKCKETPLVLSCIVVFILWLSSVLIAIIFIEKSGEVFQAIGVLFSGLAFVAIFFSLVTQNRQTDIKEFDNKTLRNKILQERKKEEINALEEQINSMMELKNKTINNGYHQELESIHKELDKLIEQKKHSEESLQKLKEEI